MAESTTSRISPVRDVVDYELLFDCVHCGLCLEACPTYALTRAEMDSPRGRIYLMKSLAEGRLELDSDAVRHLDLCLGCRACETACPSGVHYGKLIEGARDWIERRHRRPLADRVRRAAISAIFPFPSRMRLLLAPIRLADRTGLRRAIYPLLPRAMREWLDLLPPPAEEPNPLTPFPEGGKGERGPVVLHHGCVAQVLAPSANLNSERALQAAGFRVLRLAETVCCGALDLHSGNLERARRFARANVRAIKQSGAEAIVSAASGCSAAIAGYGYLLRDDPELAADARDVAAKVRDLSAMLVERSFIPAREFRCTVTFHDACHLAHGLGVRESPRSLLRSIPGVTLVEMAESDMCCGSAGSYNLTEPATARELARRKADNVIATGADFVVLSNPGCEFQIAAELRRRASKTRVIGLADFLALAAQSQSPPV
jgi:glycolate oxidase iron-sulfur subunit